MTQSFSNDIPPPKTAFTCECYKKLQSFGIPLLTSEENDLYGENGRITTRESVFQLPGILKMNKSIRNLPDIMGSELFYVFEQMAEIFPNLSDFEQNVVSFWILDVLIEGLWTAQNAKMEQNHQRATLLWIAYFFNYIQMHNPSRKDLFLHLKTVLFRPEFLDESVGETEEKSGEVEEGGHEGKIRSERGSWKLPLPPEISPLDSDSVTGEQSSNENETEEEDKNSFPIENDSKSEGNDPEINVKHMKIILEILYRIFARLWVFMELQKVFNEMPSVETVDLPFDLKAPKPLYRPQSATVSKAEKGGKRLSHSEKSLEDVEKRQLHKNNYILPLQEAEESKTYIKYLFGQQTSDRSMPKKKN